MYLPDMTVTDVDGATLFFGSLPEAATATTAGTPDWCTGFEETPSSHIDSRVHSPSIGDSSMMDLFPDLCTEETVFPKERSKAEQRSDRLTLSGSMGSQVDLPRLDQMMAPSAPVPPLTPVSDDLKLTLPAQGKQPRQLFQAGIIQELQTENRIRRFVVVGRISGTSFAVLPIMTYGRQGVSALWPGHAAIRQRTPIWRII